MIHKVFVYGSLKRGFHNHSLLENSKFLTEAFTTKDYTMISLGGFPGVIFNGDTSIHGELYEVDDSTFARLDRLEGYPNFYNRTIIETSEGEAWIYHLTEHYISHPIVKSGVWQ